MKTVGKIYPSWDVYSVEWDAGLIFDVLVVGVAGAVGVVSRSKVADICTEWSLSAVATLLKLGSYNR